MVATTSSNIKIGVVAVQGGYKEIAAMVNRHDGVEAVEIRTPKELKTHDPAGIVLPGGESTSIGFTLEWSGLLEPLRDFCKTKPVWGICAGMILLANDVDKDICNGEHIENADEHVIIEHQPLIGGLDITISRNHFGRQSQSRYRKFDVSNAVTKLHNEAYFIRAPGVTKHGPGVTVLASVGDVAVAVKQDKFLATAFHPEISHDNTWMDYFFRMCGVEPTLKIAMKLPTTVAPWCPIPTELINMQGVLTTSVKRAFAVYQVGGVIMDVVNAHQAKIAEAAGAVSVMALERIPADIKKDGGIARSSDPLLIKDIMKTVTIPVMAKARIGHFAEAQLLEALDVDCIDESEVLTAADELHHIDKNKFRVPFVCGAKNLGEALRRIAEGAAIIRLKGNAGTGNVMQAVRHARLVFGEIRQLQALLDDEVYVFAKNHQVPYDLCLQVRAAGRLPVVTFAAGGLATPADVSMLMQLGCDGVFVGSGIFKGQNPAARARAMVETCSHFRDPMVMARTSEGLGKGMVGVLDDGETYALGGGNEDSLLK